MAPSYPPEIFFTSPWFAKKKNGVWRRFFSHAPLTLGQTETKDPIFQFSSSCMCHFNTIRKSEPAVVQRTPGLPVTSLEPRKGDCMAESALEIRGSERCSPAMTRQAKHEEGRAQHLATSELQQQKYKNILVQE